MTRFEFDTPIEINGLPNVEGFVIPDGGIATNGFRLDQYGLLIHIGYFQPLNRSPEDEITGISVAHAFRIVIEGPEYQDLATGIAETSRLQDMIESSYRVAAHKMEWEGTLILDPEGTLILDP